MKVRALGMVVALGVAHCWSTIAYADTKSGEAKLDVFEKALKVSLGDKVKASCTYYIDPDFLGKTAVAVHAKVKNTSDKHMHYGYYVAFQDKDKNLVACSSFSGKLAKLKPGGENYIGNTIVLPIDQIKRLAFYQVTLLEDEKEFGK